MKIHRVFVPWLVLAGLSAGCHVEGQAQVGGAQPSASAPPPAPPPPPATASAEPPPPVPPPPPPAPPKKVIALKGVQMKSATQIDMPGDIEFQKASAKIVMNDKTKKVLTQLATILKDNPEVTKLSIEGNTDNEGENKGFDNLKLSEQRAQSVMDFLVKQGVDTKRLQAVGNGSKNPLAANDTVDHMALNRRVEFHVRAFNGQAVSADDSSAAPAGGTAAPPASAGSAAPAASAAPASSATDSAKKPMKKDKPKPAAPTP